MEPDDSQVYITIVLCTQIYPLLRCVFDSIVHDMICICSLRQVLDDRSLHMPTAQRLRIAVDVAEGMLYLHSREQVCYCLNRYIQYMSLLTHALIDDVSARYALSLSLCCTAETYCRCDSVLYNSCSRFPAHCL
jgi:hypothetical protein